MSNTELDTKPERDKQALIEYLAEYIRTEYDRAIGNYFCQDYFNEWTEEGIDAFESIHDVEVCVFDKTWKH